MSRALVKTAILYGIIPLLCAAQDAKSGPQFEVASLKPVPQLAPFSVALGLIYRRIEADRFDAANQLLISLIAYAYDIQPDRISGPGWMDGQYFTIMAKLPAGSTKEQIPAMLQKLLADRFRLTVHRDHKVEPVYELVTDKKGVKLKTSAAGTPEKGCGGRPGQEFCQAVTLGQLSRYLSRNPNSAAGMVAGERPGELVEQRIDRPVIDRTGVTGVYDIDLQWAPPGGLPSGLNNPDAVYFPPRDPSAKADSIFGALETVGLKLQPGKHAFDILVVDHVERVPSQN